MASYIKIGDTPASSDYALQTFLTQVRSNLDRMSGRTSVYDQVVTFQDLIDLGIIDASAL